MTLMVWGLGACSLSQQEPSQQVRVVISPDALRSPRLARSAALQANDYLRSQPVDSSDPASLTQAQSYFLINVEGPGIPFMPMPGFPCIRLGIGTSVFVNGTEKDVPIELWVPAGADRKITVYAMFFPSGSPRVPASGESATQFFAEGAAAFDPPFVYGSAFIPNLSGDQNIEIQPSEPLGFLPLVCKADGGVGFTSTPPVLSAQGYQLRNYSPYIAPSIGVPANMSGPLKVWALEEGATEWLFRLKGLLFNSTGIPSKVSMQLAVPGASQPQESRNSLEFDSDMGLWFHDSYFIGSGTEWVTHRFFDETLNLILERTIPLAWSPNQSPVKLLPGPAPVPVLIGGAAVYKLLLKNDVGSSALKPLRVHSVFLDSVTSAADNLITVIARPANLTSTDPECPREDPGSASDLEFGPDETCEIYVRVQNAPTAAMSVRLEIEVASLIEGQDQSFRLAQFVASLPAPVLAPAQNLTGIAQISSGASHTCALQGDNVRCWGRNNIGQLGNGNYLGSSTASLVASSTGASISGASAIDSGANHACAVVGTGGGVMCWGDNTSSQLGANLLGGNSPLPLFVKDPALSTANFSGVSKIAAGESHTCALKDGQIWCWGKNDNFQVGASDEASIFALPNRVVMDANNTVFSEISGITAGGSHNCAIKVGGEVWCWGNNANGQLGNGLTSGQSQYPLRVTTSPIGQGTEPPSYLDAVIQVSGGEDYTCALKGDGTVWCWGKNSDGGLGNGTMENTPYAVQTRMESGAFLTEVTSISAGFGQTCARNSYGLWCWGKNFHGQLGNGTAVNSPHAVLVSNSLELARGGSVSSLIATGSSFSCAISFTSYLDPSGTVKCWGLGTDGQLGGVEPLSNFLPVTVKVHTP